MEDKSDKESLPHYLSHNTLKQVILDGFIIDKGGYSEDSIAEILRWFKEYRHINAILNKQTWTSLYALFTESTNIQKIMESYLYDDHIEGIGKTQVLKEDMLHDAVQDMIYKLDDNHNPLLIQTGFYRHSICVYLYKNGPSYHMYIINSGSGIEYHPIEGGESLTGDVIIRKTLDRTSLSSVLNNLMIACVNKQYMEVDNFYYYCFAELVKKDFLENELTEDIAELPLQKSGTCAFHSIWYSVFLHLHLHFNISKDAFLQLYDNIKLQIIKEGLDEVRKNRMFTPFVYNTIKILKIKYDEVTVKDTSLKDSELDQKFINLREEYAEAVRSYKKFTFDHQPEPVYTYNPKYDLLDLDNLEKAQRKYQNMDQDEENLARIDMAFLATIKHDNVYIQKQATDFAQLQDFKFDLIYSKLVSILRCIDKSITEAHEIFYHDHDTPKNNSIQTRNTRLLILHTIGQAFLTWFAIIHNIGKKYEFTLLDEDKIEQGCILLDYIQSIGEKYINLSVLTPRVKVSISTTDGEFYIKAFLCTGFMLSSYIMDFKAKDDKDRYKDSFGAYRVYDDFKTPLTRDIYIQINNLNRIQENQNILQMLAIHLPKLTLDKAQIIEMYINYSDLHVYNRTIFDDVHTEELLVGAFGLVNSPTIKEFIKQNSATSTLYRYYFITLLLNIFSMCDHQTKSIKAQILEYYNKAQTYEVYHTYNTHTITQFTKLAKKPFQDAHLSSTSYNTGTNLSLYYTEFDLVVYLSTLNNNFNQEQIEVDNVLHTNNYINVTGYYHRADLFLQQHTFHSSFILVAIKNNPHIIKDYESIIKKIDMAIETLHIEDLAKYVLLIVHVGFIFKNIQNYSPDTVTRDHINKIIEYIGKIENKYLCTSMYVMLSTFMVVLGYDARKDAQTKFKLMNGYFYAYNLPLTHSTKKLKLGRILYDGNEYRDNIYRGVDHTGMEHESSYVTYDDTNNLAGLLADYTYNYIISYDLADFVANIDERIVIPNLNIHAITQQYIPKVYQSLQLTETDLYSIIDQETQTYAVTNRNIKFSDHKINTMSLYGHSQSDRNSLRKKHQSGFLLNIKIKWVEKDEFLLIDSEIFLLPSALSNFCTWYGKIDNLYYIIGLPTDHKPYKIMMNWNNKQVYRFYDDIADDFRKIKSLPTSTMDALLDDYMIAQNPNLLSLQKIFSQFDKILFWKQPKGTIKLDIVAYNITFEYDQEKNILLYGDYNFVSTRNKNVNNWVYGVNNMFILEKDNRYHLLSLHRNFIVREQGIFNENEENSYMNETYDIYDLHISNTTIESTSLRSMYSLMQDMAGCYREDILINLMTLFKNIYTVEASLSSEKPKNIYPLLPDTPLGKLIHARYCDILHEKIVYDDLIKFHIWLPLTYRLEQAVLARLNAISSSFTGGGNIERNYERSIELKKTVASYKYVIKRKPVTFILTKLCSWYKKAYNYNTTLRAYKKLQYKQQRSYYDDDYIDRKYKPILVDLMKKSFNNLQKNSFLRNYLMVYLNVNKRSIDNLVYNKKPVSINMVALTYILYSTQKIKIWPQDENQNNQEDEEEDEKEDEEDDYSYRFNEEDDDKKLPYLPQKLQASFNTAPKYITVNTDLTLINRKLHSLDEVDMGKTLVHHKTITILDKAMKNHIELAKNQKPSLVDLPESSNIKDHMELFIAAYSTLNKHIVDEEGLEVLSTTLTYLIKKYEKENNRLTHKIGTVNKYYDIFVPIMDLNFIYFKHFIQNSIEINILQTALSLLRNKNLPKEGPKYDITDLVSMLYDHGPTYERKDDTYKVLYIQLLFEFSFGFYVRQEQLDMIKDIYTSMTTPKKTKFYQLLMGKGKSSVIAPLAGLFLLTNPKFARVYLVVPSTLISQTVKNMLKAVNGFMDVDIYVDKIDKETQKYKLLETTNSIHVLNDASVKSLKLNYHIGDKTWSTLEDTAIIFDEIDDLIDPLKAELNYVDKVKNIDGEYISKIHFMYTLLYMLYVSKKYLTFRTSYEKFSLVPHLHLPDKTSYELLLANQDFQNLVKDALNDIHIQVSSTQMQKIIKNEAMDDSTLDFARLYIHKVLRLAMTKIHRRHFGLVDDINETGIYKPNFIAVPYTALNKPSLKSEFSSTELTITLTILCYLDESKHGLRKVDIVYYIKHLLLNAKKFGIKYLKYTQAAKKYETLFKDITDKPSFISLYKKVELTQNMYEIARNNDILRKEYIIYTLLTKLIKISEYVYNIAFLDVVSSTFCEHRTGFSGTPYFEKPYDLSEDKEIDDIIIDKVNEGAIKSAILGKIVREPNIYGLHKIALDILGKVIIDNNHGCLIDVGCLLLDYTAEEVAKGLRTIFKENYMQMKGIVYINTKDVKQYIDVESGQIADLSHYPYSMEHTFVYFDQTHIVGQDIPMKITTKGLVTINFFTTYRDIGQGIFRLRKLNFGQSVDFIGYIKIVSKILSKYNQVDHTSYMEYKDFPSMNLLSWCISLEDEYRNSQLSTFYVQTIKYLIRELVIAEPNLALKGDSDVLALYTHPYKQGNFNDLNTKITEGAYMNIFEKLSKLLKIDQTYLSTLLAKMFTAYKLSKHKNYQVHTVEVENEVIIEKMELQEQTYRAASKKSDHLKNVKDVAIDVYFSVSKEHLTEVPSIFTRFTVYLSSLYMGIGDYLDTEDLTYALFVQKDKLHTIGCTKTEIHLLLEYLKTKEYPMLVKNHNIKEIIIATMQGTIVYQKIYIQGKQRQAGLQMDQMMSLFILNNRLNRKLYFEKYPIMLLAYAKQYKGAITNPNSTDMQSDLLKMILNSNDYYPFNIYLLSEYKLTVDTLQRAGTFIACLAKIYTYLIDNKIMARIDEPLVNINTHAQVYNLVYKIILHENSIDEQTTVCKKLMANEHAYMENVKKRQKYYKYFLTYRLLFSQNIPSELHKTKDINSIFNTVHELLSMDPSFYEDVIKKIKVIGHID